MLVVVRNIAQGFIIGFRVRSAPFLGMLGLAIGIPTAALLYAHWKFDESQDLPFLIEVGPAFYLLHAFMAYLVAIKALQEFHQANSEPARAARLAIQVDVVVMAALFALIFYPVFK